jgi:hypothetical protein
MKHVYRLMAVLLVAFSGFNGFSQQDELKISGNTQLDAQSYSEDSITGAEKAREKMLAMFYTNVIASYKNFNAGMRFEGYMNSLQGYLPVNEGFGIPYFYVGYQNDHLEVTVGSFYEQFGSGLILRTYEEKTLGYDNALNGIRIKANLGNGLSLKAVYGKQRLKQAYINNQTSLLLGDGIVRGLDAELVLNEAIGFLKDSKTGILFGASFVSKFQADQDQIYKLPENVAAGAGRLDISRGKINFSTEYVYRSMDPSAAGMDNSNGNVGHNFIYKAGQGLILNASYSTKGLGIYLAAKSIDNLNFRSDRMAKINDLLINFIPDYSKNHTYAIAAMYPYGTQPNGEAGIQASIQYNLKKKSKLGGAYGTDIKLDFSRMFSLKKTALDSLSLTGNLGTEGYTSSLFAFGNELFYQDIALQIDRKFSNKVKGVIILQDLRYNNSIIHGAGEYDGTIHAMNVIADVYYRFTTKKTLRTEFQHMITEQDKGNWAGLLFEYTIPKWFFIVGDLYNYGNPEEEQRVHYYTAAIAYSHNANRIQVGFGKQREGVVCTGGICRRVPASYGFNVSITSSF